MALPRPGGTVGGSAMREDGKTGLTGPLSDDVACIASEWWGARNCTFKSFNFAPPRQTGALEIYYLELKSVTKSSLPTATPYLLPTHQK